MGGFDILSGVLSHVVANGPLIVAAGVAVLVGVIGFLSPCVLPLVPGYVGFVAGLSADEGRHPRRAVLGALLFVLGFSVVFVSGGVLFGSFGQALRLHLATVDHVLGAMTILFGLVFVGRVSFLQRELKFRRLPSPGLAGAPLLGAAFGLAWGPCLTPTFGTIYLLSQSTASAGRGALLSFCYCLGIGVPFVLFACGFGWVNRSAALARRHARKIAVGGGVLLVGMGLLMLTNQWQHWMDVLRAHSASTGFDV